IAPDGDDPQTGEVLTNSSFSECRAIQERTGNRTMSKSTKNPQATSRAPVDALQYEKLALSAFDLCNRQLDQLKRLVTLPASIRRTPCMTREERQSQQALLELLVETGEGYEREIECDRELYQVIALDAKDVPHSRITAKRAASLLSEAVRKKSDEKLNAKPADTTRPKPVRTKVASRAEAGAQAAAVAH
ncbi:hypothetical protein, partial [Paraburkholderia madseniana]